MLVVNDKTVIFMTEFSIYYAILVFISLFTRMLPKMTPIAGFAMKVERFCVVTSAHACSTSSARAWGQSPRERETGTVLFARLVSVKCASFLGQFFFCTSVMCLGAQKVLGGYH